LALDMDQARVLERAAYLLPTPEAEAMAAREVLGVSRRLVLPMMIQRDRL
jgi:hypothetical protein